MLPYFYGPLRALFLSRIFVEFLHNLVYPTGWEKFEIYGDQITGKCIFKSKIKMDLNIFSDASTLRENFLQGSYHHLPSETTHSPRQESLFPKQKGGTMVIFTAC